MDLGEPRIASIGYRNLFLEKHLSCDLSRSTWTFDKNLTCFCDQNSYVSNYERALVSIIYIDKSPIHLCFWRDVVYKRSVGGQNLKCNQNMFPPLSRSSLNI